MNATSASSRPRTLLHLDDAQRRLLKSAGATDLKGIAAALKAAPELERHDAEVERVRQVFEEPEGRWHPPDPIKFSISSKAGKDITEPSAPAWPRIPPWSRRLTSGGRTPVESCLRR